MKSLTLILGRLAAMFAAGTSHHPVLVRGLTRDSNAFIYNMPSGIPGVVTRVGSNPDIEPNQIDEDTPPLAYGVPVAMTADGVRPITGGDTAAVLYGVLVRPFPTNAQTATGFFGSSPLGTAAVPPVTGVCDVLKRGYMTVQLYGAAAAVKGGVVYVRIANAGAGEVVGGFEAAADGGDTIVAGIVTTTYFMGPADANGNVEIAWNV